VNEEIAFHKELDLIQSVIRRMANNSFLIKGWIMTLMSALIAFGKDLIVAENSGVYYLVMMVGILIPFWWLNAYYLRAERIFRNHYDIAVNDPTAKNRVRFCLVPTSESKKVDNVLLTMFSSAILWFFMPAVLLIAAGIILKINGAL